MRGRGACLLLIGGCLLAGCGDDGYIVTPDAGVSVDLALALPPQPNARFAVIGDFGVNTADEHDVARLVRGWHPDYIITVGDNNYPNGETATIDGNIGQYFAPFIGNYQGKYGPGSGAKNRFWPCLGNHDWYAQTGAQPYVDYFPALPGNRRYYDVAIGDVHFFAVDSDPHEPDGIDATSAQAAWLKGALAASKECFNVVFFHHPAFSSGAAIFTEPRMRWPFAEWGADVVLMGHQHQYERLFVNGLTYVVDGLGGALNRFDFAITPAVGSLVRYNAEFGALAVEVFDGGTMSFTFRNTHDMVIDRFDIKRDCSTPHEMVDAGI